MNTNLAETYDTMMLIAAVASIHPQIKTWVDSGKLVRVERERVLATFDDRIVFTFNSGRQVGVTLSDFPHSGSVVKKDMSLIDSLREALTDEAIASMALLS